MVDSLRTALKTRGDKIFLLVLTVAAVTLNLTIVPLATAGSWVTNGPMIVARFKHTATLLPNGKVLVAGGLNSSYTYFSSAELYDPTTGKWTMTGSMTGTRAEHTATLLPNGKVLVTGGNDSDYPSAELYDPATGSWTATGELNAPRYRHTATLLPNGKVLVAGGMYASTIADAELYDPATGTWTVTGELNTERCIHTATLLSNGKVLVAGGWSDSVISWGSPGGSTSSAELYDPATGTWTATGALTNPQHYQTATLLPNGKVLVAAGASSVVTAPFSAEVYDPITENWTVTGTPNAAHEPTATLLPDGKVLVAGGYAITGFLSSAELYDPATGMWTAAGVMSVERWQHTATLLPNGKVLIAGGLGGINYDTMPSTELYDSANGAWMTTGALNTGRFNHTATLLPCGKVLVAGGVTNGTYPYAVSSAELYDSNTGTWEAAGNLSASRQLHTATLLPDGKVLVSGGFGPGGYPANAELYDPTTGFWTTTGALAIQRFGHTATLIYNGKVLVAGGFDTNSSPLSSAEIYDPAAGTWTLTGRTTTPRGYHTATLLPNGKVLLTAGVGTSSAELYDPATGTWTPTGALSTPRYYHSATLLASGRVLVVGGYDGLTPPLVSAELYDPATEIWSPTGALNTGRDNHTATLLTGGQVLIAGGAVSMFYESATATAELYDPATGLWTALTNLQSAARIGHTATLLPDGAVLVVGGYDSSSSLSSAELYHVGLGFSPAWQPQIATVTSPLSLGGCLTLSGLGFLGISGASGGNSQDSPSNYPVVQLRSIEGGQTLFLPPAPDANCRTNSFTSGPVRGLAPGYALATVFVNGIPSTGSVVSIRVPIPTATTLTEVKFLANGSFQFGFTNTPGAIFGVLATSDLRLPLSNWAALGGAIEVLAGQFAFTDQHATNSPQRFYRVHSP